MCRTSRAASGSTAASAASSCMPGRVLAARASRRIALALVRTAAGRRRAADASSRRVVEVNDARKRGMADRIVARLRRQRHRQDDRGARPHLQAQHRRHARQPEPRHPAGAASRPARRSAPSIPKAWPKRGSCCPSSTIATTPMRRWTAPTRWCSLTEWNEFRALDLARVKQPAARRPSWSTCATSISRNEMAEAGFYLSQRRPRRGRAAADLSPHLRAIA